MDLDYFKTTFEGIEWTQRLKIATVLVGLQTFDGFTGGYADDTDKHTEKDKQNNATKKRLETFIIWLCNKWLIFILLL